LDHFAALIKHSKYAQLLLLCEAFDLAIKAFDVGVCVRIASRTMVDLPFVISFITYPLLFHVPIGLC